MFVRQYPKSPLQFGLNQWLDAKVDTIGGSVWYSHEEYIFHFTNCLIHLAESKGYEIKDVNAFKDEILHLLYKGSDNIS